MSTLRAELATWVERARAGEEIIVTDRGLPVARLSSVETAPLLEQLTAQGVLGKARGARPQARGASRVQPREPVSELIAEQRR
ncbi:MAG: type II toxin-antitoxin system prevent-host-death family antitoxin [Mycetocola sp.]